MDLLAEEILDNFEACKIIDEGQYDRALAVHIIETILREEFGER